MSIKIKHVVAAFACAFSASAVAATLSAYSFGPSDSLANVQGLRRVLAGIEKSTNGELKFRLRLAGSLPIDAANITQAVGNGTIFFADDGFYLGNVKIAGVLRLPMLIRNKDEYDKALAIMEPYVDKEYERQGAIVLGHFLFPYQVAFSRKATAKLDDMRGQKLRVTSPEQAEFVKRMGGIPVTLGVAEVPSALQTGTVDGVFTASAGGGKIWGDMLKTNYRLPVNFFDGFYIVNKAAFEKLTPDQQKEMRDVVQRLAPTTTAQLFKEEDEVTSQLKAKGMQINMPNQADVDEATKRMADYWDSWAKNEGGDAVPALAAVRKALGR